MSYLIRIVWDSEAAVWVATSNDVPGLVLESESFDTLIQNVRDAVPELLHLNGKDSPECRLSYSTMRSDVVAMYG